MRKWGKKIGLWFKWIRLYLWEREITSSSLPFSIHISHVSKHPSPMESKNHLPQSHFLRKVFPFKQFLGILFFYTKPNTWFKCSKISQIKHMFQDTDDQVNNINIGSRNQKFPTPLKPHMQCIQKG